MLLLEENFSPEEEERFDIQIRNRHRKKFQMVLMGIGKKTYSGTLQFG